MSDDDLPRNAAKLVASAEQAGWTAHITHNNEHNSVAVRLRRGDQRAAAIWHAGKFHGAWVLGRMREAQRTWPMPHRLGSRDLTALINEEQI